MRPEELREFANRDWSAIAEQKRGYWLGLTRARGPLAALRAADALREQAAAFGDRASRAAARAEDLAHHIRLKQRIDASSSAFRR